MIIQSKTIKKYNKLSAAALAPFGGPVTKVVQTGTILSYQAVGGRVPAEAA